MNQVMYKYTTKRCSRCLIQEDPFHHIAINERGLCNLCSNQTQRKRLSWDELKAIFEEKTEKVRGKGDYDGLIMLSGGKDSAYLAYMLKKVYGLNLLGFILDTNYEYSETFENARKIAHQIDIPYIIYRQDPRLMQDYFSFLFTEKSICQKDFGQVCTFCGRFLIRTTADFAKRMNIPLVFSGHNPDQILLMGRSIEIDPGRQTIMEFAMETVYEELAKAKAAWRARKGSNKLPFFAESLNPPEVELVFPFQHFPYRPKEMKETVCRELNWIPITSFSKTYIASGCRLVKLWAYLVFLNQTNSYVDFELSNQIRNGILGYEVVKSFYDQATVDYDELESLIRELGIACEMRKMLEIFSKPSEQLLQRLKEPGAQ